MSSCISDVRRNVEKVVRQLFDEIPELHLSNNKKIIKIELKNT
jgi:hypothetical protein